MKRITVGVISTALLMAWSVVTRAETPNQRMLEMLFGKGSGEQSPQPGASTQPWQTSWEAFCAELKRLYAKEVPPPEEIDALFAGKRVTWEGNIAGINEEPNAITKRRMNLLRAEGASSIKLRMPDCRVTVTGADSRSAEVLPLILIFENQSEMDQSFNRIGLGDSETLVQQAFQRKDAYELFTQKIRFTTTLEPLDLKVDTLPAVSWEHFTDEKEGFERNQISIYTGYVRLLGHVSGSPR